MLRRELTRDTGVNLSLLIVLALSAFLMATGAAVLERLASASGQLFEQTQPPHFLQMHSGDYDPKALTDFVDAHPSIQSSMIEDMVDVDGMAVSWQRTTADESGSMADSQIDNLFVRQNTDFDFLIDDTGSPARPDAGEVFIPVAYQLRYGLNPGDTLTIDTGSTKVPLTIAGVIRDGQMASSLSSSTRFLVSDKDWQTLKDGANTTSEIIVAFRLHDTAEIPALQSAYEADSNVPQNGQAVTLSLIRLINVISDGIVAIALMFVSLALVVIALINVRFVIRRTLVKDVQQIGTMRAIGLPASAISSLYLTRYRLLTALACLIGGAAAIGGVAALTRSLQANYAHAEVTPWSIIIPILALVAVYVLVLTMCRAVLRAVRRVDVVSALVHGSLLSGRKGARVNRRRARWVRRTNLEKLPGTIDQRLALKSLLAEGKTWMLLPLVFALATLVITIPLAVQSTFASPQFITYMGSPDRDLRSDIRFTDHTTETRDDLLAAMESEAGIAEVAVLGSVLYRIDGVEGPRSQLVDIGDHRGLGTRYLSGSAPSEGEISVSDLAAETYGVDVGDDLILGSETGEVTARVSGVYQDVTNGGVTAKMQGQVPDEADAYTVFADVRDGESATEIAEALNDDVPAAKTLPMDEYVQQTFSSISDALRSTAVIAIVFGLFVAVLITTLFLRLVVVQERGRSGILRTLGFSPAEVSAQTSVKTIAGIVVGVIAGVLGASLLGPPVVGAVLSVAGVGLADFAFLVNPILKWVVLPLILVVAGGTASFLVARQRRTENMSEWLKG
ncbi:putative ABC transport system permease protein [Brevibacterium aurantiacum]|uniref:Putative ABC transport system permease protein n=2 Tax=Brevibacterium aurantiacum TaxID=273384 RepID=A0A2H1IUR1_BREAU|nr:putative ABC transport system permease protein [Brevibacterium aurantiacum]